MKGMLGIDTGGTFTDIVFFDGKAIRHEKIPSCPANPAQAVGEGVKLLGQEKIEFLIHGTTVGTNAVLEGKGGRVALVTTKGFKDIIEIGRQTRHSLYDFFVDRPAPLVARKDRHEVSERTNHEGIILMPLKDGGVVERIRKSGCDSIAVCFLHSYANPSNEKKMGRALKGLHVSISSEVLNEYREYERFSTTVLDAYTRPVMADYLSCLKFPFKIFVMQSNGGVLGVEEAARKSVTTLLSGPAGGVRGASYFSKISGISNLLTFDMGGTSTDVCLIEKGKARFSRERKIGSHPCSLPMMDIHTVGAGGGSIGWVDSGGALHVGPQSAGASPGPACYGAGKDATVTDADLILGYINPYHFLGGRMRLQEKKSKAALISLAKRLKVDFLEASWGMFCLVNANMVSALKVISVQKGVDPDDFTLFAFGGAGPVHGAFLARELGMKSMLVPSMPGVFSAFGLLASDIEKDYSCTRVMCVEDLDDRKAGQIYGSLEKEGGCYERSADLRYKGQSHEIEIPFLCVARLEKDFHDAHRRLYGYSSRDKVEIVNFKTKKIERITKPRIKRIRKSGARKALKGRRNVFFGEDFVESAIYERRFLGASSRIAGPAIVEEETSTTVIPPRCRVKVDDFGNLLFEVRA